MSGSEQHFAFEAEQAVIRAVLEDTSGDALTTLRLKLKADDIYTRVYRKVFEAACYLMDEGDSVAPAAVVLSMVRGEIDVDDVAKRLIEDAYLAPLVYENLSDYAALIIEKAKARGIAAEAQKLIEKTKLIGAGLSSDDVLRELESLPQQFERIEGGVDSILEAPAIKVQKTLGWMQQINDGTISTIKLGIPAIDDHTGGHLPTDFVVVAGRPAMGKSAFMLTWALNFSTPSMVELIDRVKKPLTVIFSQEMSDVQLTLRALANLGRINHDHLKRSQMTDEEYDALSMAVSRFAEGSIQIDDTPGLSPSLLRNKLRLLRRTHNLKGALILIDYLQLMSADRPIPGNRNAEVTEISRQLKLIAKEFECVIVALSQLSRQVEQRTNKRPMMSDLRESGAIEQDADAIYMLYRDEYYNPDTDMKGIVEVILAKMRNGEPRTLPCEFEGAYQNFKSPTHYRSEAYEEMH